jgi:hypothetical protein
MTQLTQPFSEDRDDKNNPLYTFTPPVNYTPQEVEAGEALIEILNNSDLSKDEKRSAVWEILNK